MFRQEKANFLPSVTRATCWLLLSLDEKKNSLSERNWVLLILGLRLCVSVVITLTHKSPIAFIIISKDTVSSCRKVCARVWLD